MFPTAGNPTAGNRTLKRTGSGRPTTPGRSGWRTAGEDVPLVPRRLGLKGLLRVFLDFRLQTVTRRLTHDLRVLRRRIHVLEGFETLFSGIDKAIQLIRGSTGKDDAREKLMAEFPLDSRQATAILDLQLYRISRLEIDVILGELAEKRAEADRLETLLGSEPALWKLIREELKEIAEKFGDKRRTTLGGSDEIEEFDPTAYIVKEDTNVVLTRDGWVKRLGTINAIDALRTREGDATLAVLGASTLDAVVFFAEDGTAYTLPVEQIPASTGYGEPLGKHVKLDDGVGGGGGADDRPAVHPRGLRGRGHAGPRPAPVRRHRRRSGLPRGIIELPRPEHPRRAEVYPARRGR